MIFLNSHGATGLSKPTSPSFVEIGGMHISTPKPLPNDLEQFLSNAEYGVVYFSLGTFVRYDSLNQDIIRKILNVFGKLKQNVLWKWSGTLENVPDNVLIRKWVPQQDVLSKYIITGVRRKYFEKIFKTFFMKNLLFSCFKTTGFNNLIKYVQSNF